MNAIETIANSLQAFFAEQDAKIADGDVAWAMLPDGFRGVFWINGNRRVTVEAILAGGYNIQRLHQRVLCNVK
jgi:hypothetical protein